VPRPNTRFHGRVDTDRDCTVPGCDRPGEFRAPGQRRPSFDGPGEWQWLCLDHVREFNAGYDFFAGMDADEIVAAQRPFAGWERETRAFAGRGADGPPGASAGAADRPPPWANYADPLDALGARWRERMAEARAEAATGRRLTPEDRSALKVLGLSPDADRAAIRRAYSGLVRRYHPDRNGGDRSHEARLRAVIDAYAELKRSGAFG